MGDEGKAASCVPLAALLSEPPAVKREAEEDWGSMTVGRWLLLLGFVCLTIMILTHVAEGLHLVPGMGWGLPDSPGHFLDFASAVFGCALVIAGMIWVSLSARQPR
jgi:hypothetical protein